MKKICKSCGAEAHPNANFCRRCGSSLLFPYEPPRSKGRAIGSFFLYIGIWLAAQTVLSFAFIIPIAISVMSDPDALRMGGAYVSRLMMEKINGYVTLISVLSSVLFLATVTVIFTIRQKRRDRLGVIPRKNYFHEIGFIKAPISVCAVSLVLGVALNRVVTYIVDIIPWPDFFISSFEETYEPLLGGESFILVFIAAVIMAPATEEFLFRGILCSRLSPAFPSVLAVIFSSLAFGIAHGTPIAIIYASAFGVVQACIFLRHRSLYPVMLCHFGFNLIATLAPDMIGTVTLDLCVFFVCAAASVAGVWFVTKKKKEVLPEEIEKYETV
ncbi:MAG: CPBP family intramembrane metalloprotease [Clostridia bacterium]|nr:CPBP family intramembrane metalloprotease [Clostridia bacterium]